MESGLDFIQCQFEGDLVILTSSRMWESGLEWKSRCNMHFGTLAGRKMASTFFSLSWMIALWQMCLKGFNYLLLSSNSSPCWLSLLLPPPIKLSRPLLWPFWQSRSSVSLQKQLSAAEQHNSLFFQGFPRRHWSARAKRPTWTKGTSSFHRYCQLCIRLPAHKSADSSPVAALQGLQGARGPPGPPGPQGTQVSHLKPVCPNCVQVKKKISRVLKLFFKTKLRLDYISSLSLN